MKYVTLGPDGKGYCLPFIHNWAILNVKPVGANATEATVHLTTNYTTSRPNPSQPTERETCVMRCTKELGGGVHRQVLHSRVLSLNCYSWISKAFYFHKSVLKNCWTVLDKHTSHFAETKMCVQCVSKCVFQFKWNLQVHILLFAFSTLYVSWKVSIFCLKSKERLKYVMWCTIYPHILSYTPSLSLSDSPHSGGLDGRIESGWGNRVSRVCKEITWLC